MPHSISSSDLSSNFNRQSITTNEVNIDHTFDKKDIYNSLPNLSLDTTSSDPDINLIDEFLAYRQSNTETPLTTGYNYIFMTKPKLNIDPSTFSSDKLEDFENSTAYNTNSDQFFKYIAESYPECMKMLSYVQSSTNSNTDINAPNGNFIKLFSNKFENLTGINDISLGDQTTAETWRGHKITLPVNYVGSVNGGNINLDFVETDPPYILYMHKLWVDYIDKVKYGEMLPSDISIANKEIDYASSLYYFMTGPDGYTLKFWAKFVGVYPKSIPYTTYNSGQGERNIIKASYSYNYSYAEYLTIETLSEFNNVMFSKDLDYDNSSDVNFSILGYNLLGFLNKDKHRNDTTPNFDSSVPPIPDKNYSAGFDDKYSMESGHYSHAGIVRDGKNFKLVFFDA